MIDQIIDDITKNISDALNKSLNPLVKKIKESDENVKLLNKILYEMPLYQDLDKKYSELKFKYDILIDENKKLKKVIEATKNIDITIDNKVNTNNENTCEQHKLFYKLSDENIILNNKQDNKEVTEEKKEEDTKEVTEEKKEDTEDEYEEVTENEYEEVTDDEENNNKEDKIIVSKNVDNKNENISNSKELEDEKEYKKEDEKEDKKEDKDDSDEYEEVTDDEYEEVTDDEQ